MFAVSVVVLGDCVDVVGSVDVKVMNVEHFERKLMRLEMPDQYLIPRQQAFPAAGNVENETAGTSARDYPNWHRCQCHSQNMYCSL